MCFPRPVVNAKIVSKEFLGAQDMSRVQFLRIHESTEVVVVSEDKDIVFSAFHLVAPSLEGFNDSHELLIVSLVPSLWRNHLSGENGHWVPLANFGLSEIWF